MTFRAHVYEILATMAPEARTYLGIGVQEGVCVEHVCGAHPEIDVTLCDTWGRHHGGTGRGSHAHVEARLNALAHLGRRTYLDGDSAVEIPKLTGSFDLVYVDGDHSETGALTDLSNAWPLARVMVVHDVKMPSVMVALWRWLDTAEGVRSVRLYPDGTGTAVVRR